MIRVGFSGTNWTGKSTTIQSFTHKHPNHKIDLISLSELVSQSPFPMIQDQTPEASRWMLEQLRARIAAPSAADLQLFDRTPVDILAFTQYAFDLQGVQANESLLSEIHKLISDFDVIFFSEISDEWPMGEAQAPHDIGFALLMDRYMNRAIRIYDVDVVRLPSCVTERDKLIVSKLVD